MSERREKMTRAVQVGKLQIGGGAPIVVQSMLNAPQGNIPANLLQAKQLEQAGCQLIRLSVSSPNDIATVTALKKEITVPLVADIQYHHELACKAVCAGVDKIRINPRYIGTKEQVREVVNLCREYHVPIRIGVNSGSVEPELLEKYGGPTAEALADSALRQVAFMESLAFTDLILAMKSSDIRTMIQSYRIVAKECDYPLHLGLTEAGTTQQGTIKSAIAIGSLLADGIGDTIRVSLTDDPVKEVAAAKDILRDLDLLPDTPQLISCPTCGRTQIDLIQLATAVEEELKNVRKPITVAVMGCPINGTGEAAHADLGIAGGNGTGVLFKHGKVLRKVPEEELLSALLTEIERYEID